MTDRPKPVPTECALAARQIMSVLTFWPVYGALKFTFCLVTILYRQHGQSRNSLILYVDFYPSLSLDLFFFSLFQNCYILLVIYHALFLPPLFTLSLPISFILHFTFHSYIPSKIHCFPLYCRRHSLLHIWSENFPAFCLYSTLFYLAFLYLSNFFFVPVYLQVLVFFSRSVFHLFYFHLPIRFYSLFAIFMFIASIVFCSNVWLKSFSFILFLFLFLYSPSSLLFFYFSYILPPTLLSTSCHYFPFLSLSNFHASVHES